MKSASASKCAAPPNDLVSFATVASASFMPLTEVAISGPDHLAYTTRFQDFEWLTGIEYGMGLA